MYQVSYSMQGVAKTRHNKNFCMCKILYCFCVKFLRLFISKVGNIRPAKIHGVHSCSSPDDPLVLCVLLVCVVCLHNLVPEIKDVKTGFFSQPVTVLSLLVVRPKMTYNVLSRMLAFTH